MQVEVQCQANENNAPNRYVLLIYLTQATTGNGMEGAKGRQGKGQKKGKGRGKGIGKGKGNQVEKWEIGEGNQVDGNSKHPCFPKKFTSGNFKKPQFLASACRMLAPSDNELNSI